MNYIIIYLWVVMGLSLKSFGASVEKIQDQQIDIVHDTQVVITEMGNNGIELWTRHCKESPDFIALRLVVKDPLKGIPVIFALDCHSPNLEKEIQSFLEDHREIIENNSNPRIGVVVVGSFHKEQICPYLKKFLPSLESQTSYQLYAGAGNRISIAQPENEREEVTVSLSYPIPIDKMENKTDLKTFWTFYLLDKLVQEQLTQLALEYNLIWESGTEDGYPLPPACLSVTGTYNHPQEGLGMISEFVMKVRKWAKTSIDSPELFQAIKQKLLKRIALSVESEASPLADYYASIFALDKGCLDFLAFVPQSTEIIEKIDPIDLMKVAEEVFGQPFVHVDFIPENETKVKEVSYLMDISQTKESSFIENYLEEKSSNLKFSELSVTSDEIEKIVILIKTVASENIFQLLMKKRQLDRIGDQIRHVHPLRFLGIIFSDPLLKANMCSIEGSLFKWGHFIGGLAERLDQESKQDNLTPYIEGFCKLTKADIREIESLVRKKKWSSLVRYLIEIPD